MIQVSWQAYADWVRTAYGKDLEDSILEASRVYIKQYKKPIEDKEILKYLEQQLKVCSFD